MNYEISLQEKQTFQIENRKKLINSLALPVALAVLGIPVYLIALLKLIDLFN